jgi:inner membrane protein
MDPLTHGLASFALKRAFFPKAERPVLISMLLAGALVDLDWLSSLLGPSIFLKWNGGPLHSIVASLFLALLISIAIRAYAKSRGVLLQGALWWFAPICAALLHVGMDALLSSGTKLFWPIFQTRIALDWLPTFDLWVLILITLGILLPELFRLVTDEIGAKSKKPRGQTGAILAFTLIAVYVVGRGMLHSSAALMIMERTYAGESPRRGAAFPDATSPFQWHAIAETQSALHFVQVSTGPMANFDPESAVHIHKPEPSPMLDAAQKTEAAQQFLAAARFPKATVQKETEGYSVELRDLKFDVLGQTSRVVDADINLDNSSSVTFAHLEWRGTLRKQ